MGERVGERWTFSTVIYSYLHQKLLLAPRACRLPFPFHVSRNLTGYDRLALVLTGYHHKRRPGSAGIPVGEPEHLTKSE